jgi:kinesin family protein C2/C3
MSIQVETRNGPKKYNFDNCFGPDSTQEEIFEESCALIQSAIDGFNVCVFAYGQTGSGKTYTIQGDATNPGLTPRIFEELFTVLDSMDNFEINLQCYMVELYLETLKDLLGNKKKEAVELDIKEDAHGMVVVDGANHIDLTSLEEANKIFEYGLENRKTASTNMNETSSRSHLVFSILINSRNKQTGQRTVGKLSLVDLAGSERVSKTGATKERLKEALAINKSLSALGNVISALGDEGQKGKKKHIPYRDNKLTMLMKDSLGGNAKTLMFVNVSPADFNCDESNTSLTYAKRVKNIKNFAVKNTQSKQADKMNQMILELQSELTRLEKKLEGSGIKYQRTTTNFYQPGDDDEEKEFNPDEDDAEEAEEVQED